MNSNARKKVKGDYPCVLTINPELTKFVKPRGKIGLVKAVRVKCVVDPIKKVKVAFEDSYKWAKLNNIPAIITNMRFKSHQTLNKYTLSPEKYVWKRNFHVPIEKSIFDDPDVYYCDLKGEGCPSCRNCSKLVFELDTPDIYSLNLSSSGICKYSCPDCYSKIMLKYIPNGFAYDKILKNAKQRGYNVQH